MAGSDRARSGDSDTIRANYGARYVGRCVAEVRAIRDRVVRPMWTLCAGIAGGVSAEDIGAVDSWPVTGATTNRRRGHGHVAMPSTRPTDSDGSPHPAHLHRT